MRVREAQHHDLDMILELWASLMTHHQPLNPRLYQIQDHSQATYRTFVSRQISSDAGLVMVAEENDQLGGYLLGSQGQRSPVYAIRAIGMIYDLVVDPKCRRQGAGKALFEAAKAGFKSRGITHISVNYSPMNEHASRFWTAQGFAPLLSEAYLEIDS